MRPELSILILVVVGLGVVMVFGRESSALSRLSSVFTPCLRILPPALRRLLSLRQPGRRRAFWIGGNAGGLFALFCNLVPLWYSYGAYRTDGVEMVGFPLCFYSAGGFVFTAGFYGWAFLADLVFAAAVALAAGFAGVGLQAAWSDANQRPG